MWTNATRKDPWLVTKPVLWIKVTRQALNVIQCHQISSVNQRQKTSSVYNLTRPVLWIKVTRQALNVNQHHHESLPPNHFCESVSPTSSVNQCHQVISNCILTSCQAHSHLRTTLRKPVIWLNITRPALNVNQRHKPILWTNVTRQPLNRNQRHQLSSINQRHHTSSVNQRHHTSSLTLSTNVTRPVLRINVTQ